MRKFLPFLILIILHSCNTASTAEKELYTLMNGSFSSGDQSLQDSTYYDITLQLAHIWTESGEYWVYAEQALSNATHHPYAQRIYQITAGEKGLAILQPYDFREPEKFFGKWKEPKAFDSLKAEDLLANPECKIIFRKDGKSFVGESKGIKCDLLSSNSSYSTTRFEVKQEEIMNWTRGYNDENLQVWGKTNGGYIFKRIQ